MTGKHTVATSIWLSLLLVSADTAAEGAYDTGANDTEIRIGNTNPYSGPASAYGVIGRGISAYFDMVNDAGGINGRRVEFITLDDGYSPPRTLAQARRLVEREQVLLLFQTLGTPTNTAIRQYVNAKRVPHLFVATGASKWGDPTRFPWTMGWQPTYRTEAKIYAKYILAQYPGAKIAVLFQNDDYGRDYLEGLIEGLGENAKRMLQISVPYEVTDPTIDSQVVAMRNSGATVFFNVTTPKFAAQAVRHAYDIGWRPLHFLNNVSSSVEAVLRPAGLEKSVGIISSIYLKDPTDPQWKADEDFRRWEQWMDKYNREANKSEQLNVYAYAAAASLVHVLERAGNTLTRTNVMKQAASLDRVRIPMLLPGITLTTGPDDFFPIEQMQLARFDGTTWQPIGEVIAAD